MKTYVFIDAENVRNFFEDKGYIDIDYTRFSKNYLLRKLKVSKIILYASLRKGDTDRRNRYKRLEPVHEVHIKKVQVYPQKPYFERITCERCKRKFSLLRKPSDKEKGNCDGSMTLGMVKYALLDKYDEAIIFSGDGDFIDVYDFLAELGIKVTVVSPGGKDSKGNSTTSTLIKKRHAINKLSWRHLDSFLPYGLKKREGLP